MSEFDAIRPYYDHEVSDVLSRIVASRELAQAANQLIMPNWLGRGSLGIWLTRTALRLKTRKLRSVRDCQNMVASLFETVINRTIDRLSVSGLEHLSPNQHYLFVSNHRDILMDSSLLNYLLYEAGHDTCRMAVGDNLLNNTLVADLMRLNKSFVVERSAAGRARSTARLLEPVATCSTPCSKAYPFGSPSGRAGQKTVLIEQTRRCSKNAVAGLPR